MVRILTLILICFFATSCINRFNSEYSARYQDKAVILKVWEETRGGRMPVTYYYMQMYDGTNALTYDVEYDTFKKYEKSAGDTIKCLVITETKYKIEE